MLNNCPHPKESLVILKSTCGYVDAEFIYCESCGSHLAGTFSHHSDTAWIPSKVYDEAWAKGPTFIRYVSEEYDRLPTRKIVWSKQIEDLMPPAFSY